MALLQLSLTSIDSIDNGKIAAAFAIELERLASDMLDRPGDKRDRKVSLNMSLTPKVDDSGQLADIAVSFEVASQVPNRRSNVYTMDARTSRNGTMVVFQDGTGDVHQPPLPYDAPQHAQA